MSLSYIIGIQILKKSLNHFSLLLQSTDDTLPPGDGDYDHITSNNDEEEERFSLASSGLYTDRVYIAYFVYVEHTWMHACVCYFNIIQPWTVTPLSLSKNLDLHQMQTLLHTVSFCFPSQHQPLHAFMQAGISQPSG